MKDFKNKIINSGKKFFECHECSICECPVGYIVELGNIYFDSNCNCCYYNTIPRPVTWDEFKDFIYSRPEYLKLIEMEE